MSNKTIINSFLALLSLRIAEIEKMKSKGEAPTQIRVIDILPSKEEIEALETDILNLLAKQNWQIRRFGITVEHPAFIIINFSLYL